MGFKMEKKVETIAMENQVENDMDLNSKSGRSTKEP